MPDATYTVTKSADDGEDTAVEENTDEYIPGDSPVGEVFGASGPSTVTKFLKTRMDPDLSATATVTVTFAAPVPAGVLGFVVGDIDVDKVTISGVRSDGAPVTGAELVGAAFNYCDAIDASPDCSGASAPFALPLWDPSSMTVVGDDTESDGAAAWFQPSVAISTLTFLYEGNPGWVPSFRLWFTALAAPVTGTVSFIEGAASTPVTVELVGPDGSVVASTTTAADGSYVFDPALAVSGYLVRVVVPDGLAVAGANPVTVDLTTGSAVADFTLTSAVTPRFTG